MVNNNIATMAKELNDLLFDDVDEKISFNFEALVF
jgi:hypothetical protein